MMQYDNQDGSTKRHLWHARLAYALNRRTAIVLVLLALIIVTAVVQSLDRPPRDFPIDTPIIVPEGASISAIVDLLAQERVVRSSSYLYFVLSARFDDKFARAGTYFFEEPLTSQEVAEALVTGSYAKPSVVLQFPEGLRGEHMAALIVEKVPSLKGKVTARELDQHIGYLFPETYFVESSISKDELISMMRSTFSAKTEHLAAPISTSGLSLDEVVTLASIVEREANSEESMKIVAGILLTRLENDMPLQVDAAFEYLLHKTSAELTLDDLEIDSPYNTYNNRGLPPTPIANPGLTALEAVVYPTQTEYLYYLTADDGTFYYAQTFDEHKQNKERYLR